MSVSLSPLPASEREELARLVFPDATVDLGSLVPPPRALPPGALVTRFAPSPTGFIHIGSLMTSLLSWKLAQQTSGVFILRIEDTDRRREVDKGTELIVRALADVGLVATEGCVLVGDTVTQVGGHGPYVQSERMPIYHAYARDLVRRGLAYPCFLGEDELGTIREGQQRKKAPTGIYGEWARYRGAGPDVVRERIAAGERCVIRLWSPAVDSDRVHVDDVIRGRLELAANASDTVLVKSDGLPTYHFAHPIDDTLMGVSIVIRGDEWISSTPIHLQLFEALGMPMLPIAHVAPVAKQDGDSRRKLSKRLDVEAAMSYYHERGYPSQSIVEYLLNLLDSDFERWRAEHPADPFAQFQLSVDHLSRSSPLFDLAKLSNVSRDVVARFTADELFAQVLAWATEHDPTLASALRADPAYGRRALDIGRDATPPRKDIVKWSDVPARFGFFFAHSFDSMVPACYAELPALAPADAIGVVDHALDTLAAALATDGPTWHAALKAFAIENGYAPGAGAFKRDPAAFKGTVGDVAMLLRVAITGSRQSPDLHAVMQILGEATVRDRLARVRSHLAG